MGAGAACGDGWQHMLRLAGRPAVEPHTQLGDDSGPIDAAVTLARTRAVGCVASSALFDAQYGLLRSVVRAHTVTSLSTVGAL